jgi:nitroreductase
MDVFQAVQTILAVRQYQDKKVPGDVIRRIIEAGRLSGSAMNSQPWHFIVIEERAMLQKLGEISRSGPYISQAALAVVVCIEKSQFAISDASRAIQNMVLTAWAEGVGSNWVGFTGMDALKPLLSIPDSLDVLAILPFGYPVDKVGLGKKKRKPLAEVAHHESFDQPFE